MREVKKKGRGKQGSRLEFPEETPRRNLNSHHQLAIGF